MTVRQCGRTTVKFIKKNEKLSALGVKWICNSVQVQWGPFIYIKISQIKNRQTGAVAIENSKAN